MNEFSQVAGLAWILSGLAVADVLYDRITGRKRDYRETFIDLAILVPHDLIARFGSHAVNFVILLWLEPLQLIKLPSSGWVWIPLIVAADFCYYWFHRLSHRCRLFWANHVVHHSSTQLYFTTALRMSWFDGFGFVIPAVVLLLVGFDPVRIGAGIRFVLIWQIMNHTDKVGRLPLLEKIFVTPSFHRVHHGLNEHYLDKNYGAIFSFWDRLFGTYEPEKETPVFGAKGLKPYVNPIGVNFHEHLRLLNDFKNSKSWRERFLRVFGPPEWQPESGAESKSKALPRWPFLRSS